jgi:thioredoxin 1
MKVELFHSPGCSRCAAAREGLKAVAQAVAPGVEWREINVLDEMDYAVEHGVLSLPAIAIDGELVFSSLPTPQQLRAALIR